MISAREALARLREGNRRFVAGGPEHDGPRRHAGHATPTTTQEPCAIVLGCSDARVPAEIVFDQGPGNLFVIRVAGNVVAPSLVGSVEFAAERFGTRLVVVLGHTECGAVLATLDAIERPAGTLSANLEAIVDRVRPSVEVLLQGGIADDRDRLVAQAVRNNILASVKQLRQDSPVLERLIREDGLVVVGAEYVLETGVVEFIDGVPPAP